MPFLRYIPCFKLFVVYSVHCIAYSHILQGTTLDQKILSHLPFRCFLRHVALPPLSPWLFLVIR